MPCASAKGKSRSNRLIFQLLIVMAEKKRSFNSYTQQVCVDNVVSARYRRVDPTNELKGPNASAPPSITYSSRYVTKISDVFDSMNISGSFAIKYGTTGTAPPSLVKTT